MTKKLAAELEEVVGAELGAGHPAAVHERPVLRAVVGDRPAALEAR
jgi:hypothetical protein